MLYCDPKKMVTPLRLDLYQVRAQKADQNQRRGSRGMNLPLLGLFGEVGSLLSQPKRKQRERATFASYKESITEEFGDVLWYVSNLASRHDVRLSALALTKGHGEDLDISGKSNSRLTFSQLERRNPERSRQGVEDAEFFALGGAVGRLMNEYVAGEHWGLDQDEFLRRLAQSFRLLAAASRKARISLNFLAHNNLAKIQSRWPDKKLFSSKFDNDCDKDEMLPRYVAMQFVEKKVHGRTFVMQKCAGINIGDRLTDNKAKKDDYRFHDVFHLAYLAILGWSPVMRALFQVKRKSFPKIDENEDGARAILIEEGIATWIFNHGLHHQHFKRIEKLDYSLLKAVRHFVSGYEVERCPLWQWEMAILQGFEVFRHLQKNRRGWVVADMTNHSISFRKTKPRN
jgi:NTP pyrophosphatase (non-canonical NTP hydrolase)